MARLTSSLIRALGVTILAALIVIATPDPAFADGVPAGDATAHVVDDETIVHDGIDARVVTAVGARMVAQVSGTLARYANGCAKAIFVFVHHDGTEKSVPSAPACGTGDPVQLVPTGSSITSDLARDVVRYKAVVAYANSAGGSYLADMDDFVEKFVGPNSTRWVSPDSQSFGTCDRLDVDALSVKPPLGTVGSFTGSGAWGCNAAGETRVKLSPTLSSSSGPAIRMEARLVFADGSTAIYAGPWVANGDSWNGNFYLGWSGKRLRSLKLRLVTSSPSSTPAGQTIHLGDIVATQYSTF